MFVPGILAADHLHLRISDGKFPAAPFKSPEIGLDSHLRQDQGHPPLLTPMGVGRGTIPMFLVPFSNDDRDD